MLRQRKENPSFSFTIRADSPEHFLELYDELMAKGIVPLGQAELIRDIMGLKGTALVQTGLSSVLDCHTFRIGCAFRMLDLRLYAQEGVCCLSPLWLYKKWYRLADAGGIHGNVLVYRTF